MTECLWKSPRSHQQHGNCHKTKWRAAYMHWWEIPQESHQTWVFPDERNRSPHAKCQGLDASSGFWKVYLDQESAKLCTFNTPFGRHMFKHYHSVSHLPKISSKHHHVQNIWWHGKNWSCSRRPLSSWLKPRSFMTPGSRQYYNVHSNVPWKRRARSCVATLANP